MKLRLNKIAHIISSCAIIILLQACEKEPSNVIKQDPSETPKEYKITLTTAKSIGEKIGITMTCESDTWIDINNNNAKDAGEEAKIGVNIFTLVSQTFAIHGKVSQLNCPMQKITNLDLSNKNVITHLVCKNNELSSIDISNCSNMYTFDCSSNKISVLDVSKNIGLANFDCHNNKLRTIDISRNTMLTELSCDSNQLTTLNVSKNTKLVALGCSYNQLSTLDLNANTELLGLNCSNNQITTLIYTTLSNLDCSSNQLKSLNLKNVSGVINVSNNPINGAEMTSLVESLQKYSSPSASVGSLTLVHKANTNNWATKADVKIANSKNWLVYDSEGNEYKGQ